MDDLRRVPRQLPMPPTRADAREALLLQELTMLDNASSRSPRGRRGWTTRRRVTVLALVSAPVLLLAIGGAYLATHQAEGTVGGVGCYAGPSLDADTTVVKAGGDPLQICAALWADGTVGPRGGGISPAVPSLVACVLPEGSAVGVFPGGEGLCARLGLEPLPNGYPAAASRFAAMRDDLASRFGHRGCVTADEGAALAGEVLAQHGFDDWRVVVDQPVGGEGCRTLAFDTLEKVVHLVSD